MDLFKKTKGAATPEQSRQEKKKSVNTRVNPVLNFQIGLIAVLIAVYFIIDFASPIVKKEYTPAKSTYTLHEDIDYGDFTIADNKPKQVVKQNKVEQPETPAVKPKVNVNAPPVIDDRSQEIEPTATEPVEPAIDPVEPSTGTATSTSSPSTSLEGPISRPVSMVSEVPLFPGCDREFNRAERIECLNKKMARFVQRHFDTQKGNDLKTGSRAKIAVQFTIGTDGRAKDVLVRAPNEKLKKEAMRVIHKLPEMIPGKNDGVAVDVTYNLPIVFGIDD